jgi:hypothetical protein
MRAGWGHPASTSRLLVKPQDLVSYSLVTKAGASFVPTIWGVTIDETDRAFFLLEEIPNHRLDAGNPEKKQPPVHVERLDQRHKDPPAVTSGVTSMDRPRWSDRLFQMRVSTSCTYVLVRGETIVGYLTIHFADDSMFIDEVAIDISQKKRGSAASSCASPTLWRGRETAGPSS